MSKSIAIVVSIVIGLCLYVGHSLIDMQGNRAAAIERAIGEDPTVYQVPQQ